MVNKNRHDFFSNNSIPLFYFAVESSSALRYKYILSSEEMKKAGKFRFEKDRFHFIMCRSVLKLLIANYIQRKPSDITMAYGDNGKPFLENDTTLFFNVSHSDELCLLGISKYHEIGVDIEKIKPLESIDEMGNTIFNPEEMNRFETLSPEQKTDFFYTCWVRKEALFKANGFGISDEIRSLSVCTILPDQEFFRITLPSEESHWYIRDVPIPQKIKAAYCVKNQPIDYTLYHLQNSDIEELFSYDFKA